jgi:hypothetical protein
MSKALASTPYKGRDQKSFDLLFALACPVADMPVFSAGLVKVSRELVLLTGL